MDIQYFQTFLTVAKMGNMTQAAEQLNFTQPTITGQIRTLEQHFGVMLFERVGKKLYITEAGQSLIEYSEKILGAYNEARETLSPYLGSVNLGVSTSIVNYLLLPILREFQDHIPQNPVTIEMCANSLAVVKGILDNRFDLGFVHHTVSENQLTQFEIFKEQLVWVAHRKLVTRYNNSDNIEDYPILAYKTGGFFRVLSKEILEGKNFNSIIEYTDSEIMKKAILDGLGFGAVPFAMIESYLDDGVLIEFKNIPRLDFSIWITFHKDKILSQSSIVFMKILQERMSIDSHLGHFLKAINRHCLSVR